MGPHLKEKLNAKLHELVSNIVYATFQADLSWDHDPAIQKYYEFELENLKRQRDDLKKFIDEN